MRATLPPAALTATATPAASGRGASRCCCLPPQGRQGLPASHSMPLEAAADGRQAASNALETACNGNVFAIFSEGAHGALAFNRQLTELPLVVPPGVAGNGKGGDDKEDSRADKRAAYYS